MKTNYHTHTARCNHAYGTEEEYVLKAIENGYKVIGFADHSPTTYEENETSNRMHASEADDYVSTVLALKEKYADQIDVQLSFEIDAHPGNIEWMKENIINKYDLDYLIFGNHFDGRVGRFTYFGRNYPKRFVLRRYYKRAEELIKTNLFDMMAHPDLFMLSYKKWDEKAAAMSKKLCELAKEYDVILEYNLRGVRRGYAYPATGFWEVAAEVGNKVMIGLDAHNPEDFDENEAYEAAENFLSNLGLEIVKEL